MHQTARDTVRCNQLRHLVVIFETPDVVDQIRARLERRLRDRTLVGVHRNRHVKARLDRLDHRHDAVDLLLIAQLGVSRSGGFSADVDDIHAVREHLLGVVQRRIGCIPLSAVGKRIRRDVQNAHDIRMMLCVKQLISDFHHCISPDYIVSS